MSKTCKECHHMPSGRFDADGMQCFCRCHDLADMAPQLFAALKELTDATGEMLEEAKKELVK